MALEASAERVLELAAPRVGDGERLGAEQEAALDELGQGGLDHGAGIDFHAVLAEERVDVRIGGRACAAEQVGPGGDILRADEVQQPGLDAGADYSLEAVGDPQRVSGQSGLLAAAQGANQVAGQIGSALEDGEGQREADKGVNDGCVEKYADQSDRYCQAGEGRGCGNRPTG